MRTVGARVAVRCASGDAAQPYLCGAVQGIGQGQGVVLFQVATPQRQNRVSHRFSLEKTSPELLGEAIGKAGDERAFKADDRASASLHEKRDEPAGQRGRHQARLVGV